MSTIYIRLAKEGDKEAVSNFLEIEYTTAKEFKLLNPKIISELTGRVLIAECNNKIISTMRAELFSTKEEFEALTGINFEEDVDVNQFPSLYLSKAGTGGNFRNTGINSYLRMIFLKYALTNEEVKSVTGIIYDGAPRAALLQKLGYDFKQIEDHDVHYKNYHKPYLALLAKNKFRQAISTLERETLNIAEKAIISVI